MSEPDYMVTVCDACLRASCWHGEFMCEKAIGAGTKQMLASELTELDREDKSHYSRDNIQRITGVRP